MGEVDTFSLQLLKETSEVFGKPEREEIKISREKQCRPEKNYQRQNYSFSFHPKKAPIEIMKKAPLT